MSQRGSSEPGARPRRAHIEHGKRSRNGCTTCVSKKVKCDEMRPHCGRCMRLRLTCEWPAPRPSLKERRQGFGPIKSRNSGLWSPSSIKPRDGNDSVTHSPSEASLTPLTQRSLPSPGLESLMQSQDDLLVKESDCVGGILSSKRTLGIPAPHDMPWASSAETPSSLTVKTPENHEEYWDNLLNANAFALLRAPLTDSIFTATNLSFAYPSGPALGSDDQQAVLFHCKVFAPLKSTRDWSCSAHTLFLNKAYNRDMAFHFLLAVSHSELAIHYGQGPQPPQESRDHYERGSQLLLQAQNPFASMDHVSMMLSFLYMYMFWMRRDHFNPAKLRDLGRAVLAHVQTYGLDTLCASDDVLSSSEGDGVVTASEQVVLARIMTYLYDRDGFCSFFGCGGLFASYMDSVSQKRQRIWLRSRAAFFMPLGDIGITADYGTNTGTSHASELEDASTLDLYFELIILHHEINIYSQAPSVEAMALKSRIQRRLEVIRQVCATLCQERTCSKLPLKCTLMTYIAAMCFYALQIYSYRARQSPFGTRPIPSHLQDDLGCLMSAAYYATKTGQVQLLERFQWSLLIAGLEVTDPVHLEWIENHISDPAIKKGFDHFQRVKGQSPAGVTMEKVRSLINGEFRVS
ncbi:Zn(II)2Cys6 transcription factor domain-containing protein [Aspergillus stella-maris]|uniref:Zn(II)2Cys6 transcription factor domain-containing protein n=1 Tax=Aspergillus stella-maris TaxID=1810926 RepID=UPI003CCDB845